MAKIITLSNGQNVELVETWEIDPIRGSYGCVEIYDEDNGLIGSFDGALPDMDDEDFSMDELIAKVEANIDY